MDLPEIFKGPMTPGKWKALGAFLQRGGITGGPGVRVRTVGSQTIISTRRGRSNGSGGTGPFDVTLNVGGTTEAPTYSVSVADGWVNERIPGVNDPVTNATAVHKPHNLLWGADGASQTPVKLATDRRTFPITIGQQVSVVAYVAAEGTIELPSGSTEAGPTKIAVEDEDFKSIHYVPPCGDDDVGAAGEYHYKLAVLRAADGTHSAPWLELFLAGSHLDHFAELPILDNSSGNAENVGRPFYKYKKDSNTYLFRSLDATAGELTIEEVDTEDGGAMNIRGNSFNDDIQITIDGGSPVTLAEVTDGLITARTVVDIPGAEAFPGGANLNLEIYGTNHTDLGAGLWTISRASTPEAILYWRNGLFVGNSDPDGGTPPVTLITQQIDQNLGL